MYKVLSVSGIRQGSERIKGSVPKKADAQYRVCKIKRSNGNVGSSRLPSTISNYGAPLYEYVKSVRGAPANCLWIASNIDRALVNLFTAEIMYRGRHEAG